jgi:3D (Asp-Asp-Asp) domain-containing protein/peptidoglycan hydrolase CwlO-like protein
VAAIALLGAAGAQAVQSSGSSSEASQLRSQGSDLAAKKRSAALELYGLQSQLGQVQARLTLLQAEARTAARMAALERQHLADAQRILDESEARLGARLRELYVEGDPDLITVLFGAESLDEAIAAIDNLGRFVQQDTGIAAQVREARARLRSSLKSLAARSERLDRLTAQAEEAQTSLLAARSAKSAYLSEIARRQKLNAAELARLQNAAGNAEDKADTISGGSGPSPSVPAPPPGSGTRMTVSSTGYALPGTTATGIPVGWGVVAVDPSVIPLGTRMYIPGYGEGVAADTGGAVDGREIDLWFPTRAQALAWGRRTVTITIH